MKKLYECNNCGHTTPFEPDQCVICGETVFESETIIKTTNADRIRAMSDEELARWLEGVNCDWVDPSWLEWLQQEVE